MKKKVILLDLGGVVFQSSGQSNEKVDWELIFTLNEKYAHLDTGPEFFPKFLADYNALTNHNLSGRAFLKAVHDTLSMNEELVDFLKQRYPIIIVSDNYIENIAYLAERYAFDTWAIQQIYSYDYHLYKSDPAFFKRLLTEVNFPKEELLLIDDSPSKLASAKQNGIAGILFQNNEQVKEDLKQFI